MIATSSPHAPIVVGLSTAAPSIAALHWAVVQARLTDRPVHAIHTLPAPDSIAAAGIIGAPVMVSQPLLAERGDSDEITAMWEAVLPDAGWTLKLYRGDPGRVLVDRSRAAALLVIGAREHVGWDRVLHGSVGHYCLNHAQCPVVAVPAPDRPATPATAPSTVSG